MSIHTKIWPTMLLLFLATACTEDAGDSDASSNNTANAQQNAATNNADEGASDKTSFEVESTDESGEKEVSKNEIPDDQAGQETSGAAIVGDLLHLYLVAPNGSTINAIIETSESNTAPGSFAIAAPPEGSHVTWLDPINGGTFESQSGTITLDDCPTAAGDKVSGKFNSVTVTSPFDGSTRTLDGAFDLAVYVANGALFCASSNNSKNNDTSNSSANNAPMCQADYCEDGGVCCPYTQCIFSCELRCVTQDPACTNPLDPDPIACAACMEGCLDECNVSQECRTAYQALSTCDQQAGCDELPEEQSEACTEENCCSELNAAL